MIAQLISWIVWFAVGYLAMAGVLWLFRILSNAIDWIDGGGDPLA